MNPMPVVTDRALPALELYSVLVLLLVLSNCEIGELPRRRIWDAMTYRIVVAVAVLLAPEVDSCVLQQPHTCWQG